MSIVMITIDQYLGKWADCPDLTDERVRNANELLPKVNNLLLAAMADGVDLPINPATKTLISGTEYGGFRPQSCPQGAPHSPHKDGKGVDIYDPHNALDAWISQFDNADGTRNEVLEKFGLYREAPEDTPRWCHLTDRAPASGRRTFLP